MGIESKIKGGKQSFKRMDPPSLFSFSSLNEIETCPLSWILKTAKYPEIWSKRGYPDNVNLSAFKGRVVHEALEKINKNLATLDGSGETTPSVVFALKKLGGISEILKKSIEASIKQLSENPRVIDHIEYIRNCCYRDLPNLRVQTQSLLSRIGKIKQGKTKYRQHSSAIDKSPSQLSDGTYSEFIISLAMLRMVGVIDLLTITQDEIEIRDFKTGAEKDSHRSQMMIYALLWYNNYQNNPESRIANRIVISYNHGDLELPGPNVAELSQLEAELMDRIESATEAVSSLNPTANPSSENCCYCSVRHLCDDYWLFDSKGETNQIHNHNFIADLQIRLEGQYGHKTWAAEVVGSRGLPNGSKILVKHNKWNFSIVPGQIIRILNVSINSNEAYKHDSEKVEIYAMCTEISEVFYIG